MTVHSDGEGLKAEPFSESMMVEVRQGEFYVLKTPE